MKKIVVLLMMLGLVAAFGAPAIVQATAIDITTLPGYEVVTSGTFNFNGSGGWAGWSVNNGKVVLGAKIISAGDAISDFSVFRPVGPGETTPFGYTYGANEYGFILQDNGLGANNGVQMELYYADPMAGYTITKSSNLSYSATGWGGWSAPAGQVVSGGGYQFATLGAYPAVSQIALENSVWPHYTFGPNEQGWVVQSGAVGGLANVYVISFDAPEPLSITTSSLPNGIILNPYSRTLERSGGIAPFNWTISGGALPNGLTINNATGNISGTPTLSGTFSFTAKVTDVALSEAFKSLSIITESLPVRYGDPDAPPFTPDHIIQTAYDHCVTGYIIQVRDLELPGDVDCWQDVEVTLQGGFDEYYTSNDGFTKILGKLTISSGKVVVENIIIQ